MDTKMLEVEEQYFRNNSVKGQINQKLWKQQNFYNSKHREGYWQLLNADWSEIWMKITEKIMVI